MRNRIKYSQNFIRDGRLISKLLNLTSINRDDVVLEIGAGEGIITEELLKRCKEVVAFEVDPDLVNNLSSKFRGESRLRVVVGNFLLQPLPNGKYKVFSNIPFNITALVIKKLTMAINPPDEAYLIAQKEAAQKFIGRPYDIKNSQISVLLNPFFKSGAIYDFQSNDFVPKPNVEIVLMRIEKRVKSLIADRDKVKYQDFVAYKFTRVKTGNLGFTDWIKLFTSFRSLPETEQRVARGAHARQLKQEERLEKIHRTRIDKNWRKFR